MTLTCASARVSMCVMADAPIPLIIGGNKTGPRHRCTKCRLPVHGNACGTQLSDEEQLKQMGIPVPFDISCLPSEGQVEMKSFNNEGCIMCHTCASDVATKTKSQARCPDTTAAVPVATTPPRPHSNGKDPTNFLPSASSTEMDPTGDSEDDLSSVAVFANRKKDIALEWSCVTVKKIRGKSWVHEFCYAVSIDEKKVR